MPIGNKTIADSSVNGNKKPVVDAIKSIADRQQNELPDLLGRAGRQHSDDEVDDILRTLLRDGVAPYGKTRQQYNYRYHPRLADIAVRLIQDGETLHERFANKSFWREWSTKSKQPLETRFYKRFA